MNLNMFKNFSARRIGPEEAKRILTRNGNTYSDEEVKKIVDYLYALVALEIEGEENQNRKNTSQCK